MMPFSGQTKEAMKDKKANLQVAYIYNILRYTRWLEGNNEGDLVVAVQGESLLSKKMKRLNGKKVNGRLVRVVNFTGEGASVVLFTAEGECKGFLKEKVVKGVLTICDCANFTTSGGMISLVEVNKRLRFRVNLKVLKAGGISLSSRLLQLAIIEGED